MSVPFLVRIAVTMAVLPWFVLLARRIRGAREFLLLSLSFYLVVASDAANIVEKAFGVEVMDAVQHAMLPAAGIAAALGMIAVRRAVLRRGAAS